MEINAKSVDRNLLLELSGEIDHHSARNAMREMELAVDAALPKKLVLDMTGVTFMDSSGIGMMMGRYRAVQRNGGHMRAEHVNDRVKKILDMAGIGKLIEISKA